MSTQSVSDSLLKSGLWTVKKPLLRQGENGTILGISEEDKSIQRIEDSWKNGDVVPLI